MNFGSCPYDGCDGFLMLASLLALWACLTRVGRQPGQPIWYRFSRIDPQAWRAADFEAAHEIDYKAGTISRDGVVIAGRSEADA